MKPKQRALRQQKKKGARPVPRPRRAPVLPAGELPPIVFSLLGFLEIAPHIEDMMRVVRESEALLSIGDRVRVSPPPDAWGPFADGVIGAVLLVAPDSRYVRIEVRENAGDYRVGQTLNVSPLWLVQLPPLRKDRT